MFVHVGQDDSYKLESGWVDLVQTCGGICELMCEKHQHSHNTILN